MPLKNLQESPLALKSLLAKLILSSLLVGSSALSQQAPKYSQIDISSQGAGNAKTITFHISVSKGYKYNMDGPWQLKMTQDSAEEKTLAKLDKKEFSEKTGNFVLALEKHQIPASIGLRYELFAFVCTEDKTQCFREVHKGVVKNTQSKAH